MEEFIYTREIADRKRERVCVRVFSLVRDNTYHFVAIH